MFHRKTLEDLFSDAEILLRTKSQVNILGEIESCSDKYVILRPTGVTESIGEFANVDRIFIP